MKKFIVTLLILLSFGYLSAQVNLREGIVITLQGDTLSGSVDYRSDNQNSKQCVFIANGSDKYQTFLPGEIHGYRFIDNGRYYVSKTVNLGDEGEKTLFLEYIVRGEMNLYYLGSSTSANMFFFENKDGQMALLKEEQVGLNSMSIRRRNLGDAFGILSQSPKATNILWNKDNNLANTTNVVMAYNDEVCPDGACEVFQYKAAKTPKEERGYHFFVKVGIDLKGYDIRNDIELRYPERFVKEKMLFTVSPKIAVGEEFYLMRIARGFSLQTQLGYSFASGKKEFTRQTISKGQLYEVQQTFDVKEHDFEAQVGPAYQFNLNGKIQPRVRAGFSALVPITTYSYYRQDENNPGQTIDVMDDLTTPKYAFGYYAGAGILVPISKGALLFDIDYRRCKMEEIIANNFGISIGYLFK